MTQADTPIVKEETSTQSQDVDMVDADSPEAVEKDKTNLEDLFDDDDSDGEFASSAPQSTAQSELPVQTM